MRDAQVTGPHNEIDIHFEGGANVTFERCSQDEAATLSELKANGQSSAVSIGKSAWPRRRPVVSRATSSQ
jgi:hypothetical protein